MSDRVTQSYHDGDGRAGESMHSYQSVWMAHWTQTSCRAAPHVHDHMSLHLANNDDCDAKKHDLVSGLEIATDSTSTKGFTEVTEARAVRITNEGLTTSSKNLINERLDCQPFPMFNRCQNTSDGLDSKNDLDISCHRQVSRPQIDCNIEYNACTTVSHFPSVLAAALPATETSSRECHFQSEGVSQNPEELVNSSKVVGEGSLAVVGPCQDNFTGSTQMVPYRLNRGKAPVSSFMSRQEKLSQLSSVLQPKGHLSNTNLTILEHEHDDYHGRSALLVCEKKLDDHSTSGKSGTSFLRQSNPSLLLPNPSTGNNHLSVLVGERYQKMQNFSGSGFIPSWNSSPEATKSEKSYHGSYSLQRMPCSSHDAKNVPNSKDGLAGGPATLSQTTHRLVFMEKTDVNLSTENQTFRESRVSTKLKRNIFSELGLSTPLGLGQHGVNFQPLGSSTDSEGKDDIEDLKTPEVHLGNESSTETDTMDMDAFKEHNYLSGVSSSPSNKDILMVQNPRSQATIASAGDEVGCRAITSLPDINEEIPALPASVSSMDNADPSTSRTRSLDAEHLLFHAEQPINPKTSPYPNCPPGVDPSSRWLKRLRLSASDSFAFGTKCSNLGEASSHEKVKNLIGKIIKDSNSSLEPTSKKSHGKEETTAETAIFLQNGESSCVDSAKKDRDILLSHSWIKRWCRNQAATQQKKPEAVVVCEPQSTKVEFDELQKKQFPSIAAMALMGKAMNVFQPCEFRRRGSFIIWNTKGSEGTLC